MRVQSSRSQVERCLRQLWRLGPRTVHWGTGNNRAGRVWAPVIHPCPARISADGGSCMAARCAASSTRPGWEAQVRLAAYMCFPCHANIRSNVLTSCRMGTR